MRLLSLFFFYVFSFVVILALFYNLFNEEDKKVIFTPRLGMGFFPKKDNFTYANRDKNKDEYKMAIVTALINYPFENVKSFIRSLEDVDYKGHVVIIIDKKYNFSSKYPIIHYIIVNEIYPHYSLDNEEYPISKEILEEYIPKNCHWNKKRYYIFTIWLKYYRDKFDYILYCDGRDVFFQLNPSMWNFSKGVHLTLESDKVQIRNSNINVIWTKEFKMDNSIFDKPVVNSGSIFGSSNEIYEFLSKMLEILNYLNLTCQNDQGTFIYYYYSHPPFNYPVYLQKQGYGYTLALVDLGCDAFFTDYCNYKININDSKIKNLDGTIPIIVHGLERWKNTKNETRRNEYFTFINKYYPYYAVKNS